MLLYSSATLRAHHGQFAAYQSTESHIEVGGPFSHTHFLQFNKTYSTELLENPSRCCTRHSTRFYLLESTLCYLLFGNESVTTEAPQHRY